MSVMMDRPERMPVDQWDAWREEVEKELGRYADATAEYSGNHCHVRADVTIAGVPRRQVGATFTGPMAGRVWARPWRPRP